MRKIDLQRVWPEYWATHNISDTELARIAAKSADVEDAILIWTNEDWWTDAVTDRLPSSRGHLDNRNHVAID